VFDLRYHVASLTAVFVALAIGILVGVGLSGKGFVNDAERTNLTHRIADLERDRDAARELLGSAARVEAALGQLADDAYPSVVPGRLAGEKVSVLFVGPVDRSVVFSLRKAVRDAGGSVVRTRSIGVPLDRPAVREALRSQPAFRNLAGTDQLDDLGGALAREFTVGGQTPLWDALDEHIVQEREGPSGPKSDAVVVVRTAAPQHGATKAFLAGVYAGLARSGEPSAGVERSKADPSALPAFAAGGLSTIDSVDTSAGRLALVLVLSGAQPGNYGIDETADDGLLPPIPPAPR
jgi:hypothetical protein